jgi:Rhodopirellula transposase DDE domain
MENESDLRRRYKTLFKHLDERQRRLLVAADAKQLDRGGISMVTRASGLSRPTIYKGLQELQEKPLGRVRREGGGRKYIEESDPTILRRLEELIAPATRGDPMSPLRWTSKSTRHLEQTLNQEGYEVSRATVALLLYELGYSLQGASKTLEGKQHPDRNAQFEYINKMTKCFFRKGDPVISVDTKKKGASGVLGAGVEDFKRPASHLPRLSRQGSPHRARRDEVAGHDRCGDVPAMLVTPGR